MNKSLAVFAFTTFFMITLATTATPKAFADWLLDRSGTLVRVDGYVLGDDDSVELEVEDEREEVKTDEAEKNRMEQAREMVKDRQEDVREAAEKKLENQIEARKKIQDKVGARSKVEIKSEGDKLKIKQEILDKKDKLVRKQEIEVKDGERFMVEAENKEKIEMSAIKDGQIELRKNNYRVRSELDVKVGEKNEISVTLPNGKTKEISLPNVALERLVENGVILSMENGEESQYELIAGKNGDPAYEIEGQVEKKLFGLFKLKFAQKMEVAAASSDDGSVEAGDVVETESRETGWRRLFERFSIQ